jgi:hypothetical protein
MAKNAHPLAHSMTAEKLRQIQELRRSSAATPINSKRITRRDDRRRAINESKDN